MVGSSCCARSSPVNTEVGWYDSNCGRGFGLTDSTSAKCRSNSTAMSSVIGEARHGDLGAARAVALRPHAEVIVSGRDAVEAVVAVFGGAGFAAELIDHDQRARHGLTVLALRDPAAQRGARLRRLLASHGDLVRELRRCVRADRERRERHDEGGQPEDEFATIHHSPTYLPACRTRLTIQ